MRIRWTKLLTASLVISVITIFSIGSMSLQAAEKTYTAGIEAAFPPWAYAEKGEYKGIAVDAMRKIAEISGIKVEFKDLPWPSLIPALGKGKIDLLVTGLSVTCERDKIIDYTIPWWEINQEILIKKGSNKNAITSMCCGATVASQAGSTAFEWIENNLKEKGVKIKHVGYEDYVTAVEDLIIGRVDSVLCDTDTSLKFIAEGRPIVMAGTINVREPYALAVTGGDPHKLLAKLNKGIMALYKSGEWEKIVHKYIPGAPIKNIPAFMPDCIETYKAPIPGF